MTLPSACRRRVALLMVQIPPFSRGEVAVVGSGVAIQGGDVAVRGSDVAVRGGMALTSQPTSVKNAENGGCG
jgi:hypothetical protein